MQLVEPLWLDKLKTNCDRDQRNMRLLREQRWRVLPVWECILNGKTAEPAASVADAVKAWLGSDETLGEMPGALSPADALAHQELQR